LRHVGHARNGFGRVAISQRQVFDVIGEAPLKFSQLRTVNDDLGIDQGWRGDDQTSGWT